MINAQGPDQRHVKLLAVVSWEQCPQVICKCHEETDQREKYVRH
jgi:hypothetical protein